MVVNNTQENDGPFYFFTWCVATHASWEDLSEDLADTQPNSRAEEAWQVIWHPRVHSRHCLASCWADMGEQLPWDLNRVTSIRGRWDRASSETSSGTHTQILVCVCVRGKVVWHLSVTSWHTEVSRFSGKLLPSLLPLPVRSPSLWKESSISESGVPDVIATTQGGIRSMADHSHHISVGEGLKPWRTPLFLSLPPFPPFLKGPHLSPWASEPLARLLFSH